MLVLKEVLVVYAILVLNGIKLRLKIKKDIK